MVDINTTPLVDVLLVLLVMLIITIPVQLHSVAIEMPGGTPPPQATPPEVVKIDMRPAASCCGTANHWPTAPRWSAPAGRRRPGRAARNPHPPRPCWRQIRRGGRVLAASQR
jgi:hypothetical protein